MARSIQDADRQVDALRGIAIGLFQVGQTEQASAVARLIEDADRQADVLRGIAIGLFQVGQTEQALAVALEPGRRPASPAFVGHRRRADAGWTDRAGTLGLRAGARRGPLDSGR